MQGCRQPSLLEHSLPSRGAFPAIALAGLLRHLPIDWALFILGLTSSFFWSPTTTQTSTPVDSADRRRCATCINLHRLRRLAFHMCRVG